MHKHKTYLKLHQIKTIIFESGTYRIFSGLYWRGFAGETAVPVGGEDVHSKKAEMAIYTTQ
jgi:hypothetical protein